MMFMKSNQMMLLQLIQTICMITVADQQTLRLGQPNPHDTKIRLGSHMFCRVKAMGIVLKKQCLLVKMLVCVLLNILMASY